MSVSAASNRRQRLGGPPWLVITLAWVAHFWRFGYSFGVSDQDEVIPQLLAQLEPGLFANDWYVQFQLSGIGVRTYFVYLLEVASRLIPMEWVFGALYVVMFVAVAWAMHALTLHLGGNRVAAGLVVLVGLVATQGWTLGANDLTPAVLIPRSLAWAAGLWAVVLVLRHRHFAAGVLLGVGALLQPLVGLQMAGLAVCGLVGERLQKDTGSSGFGRLAAGFVLVGLPGLGPSILEQLAAVGGEAPPGGPSVFFLIANFRAPHHYLPGSFPRVTYEHFAALAILGLLGFAWLSVHGRLRHRGFVGGALAGALAGLIAGFVFTELIPIEFVMKLQLFNLTVPTKVLLLALIAGAGTAWMNPEWTNWWRFGEGRQASSVLAAAVVILAALAYFPSDGPLHGRYVVPGTDFPNESELYAWVRENTPDDAVFSIPPSWDRFRSFARRAIVVNFKAFPFEDDALYTWFERLTTVAPIPIPDRTDSTILSNLDAAYGATRPEYLVAVLERYGARYAVFASRPTTTHERLEEVFANDFGVVYELTYPR